jgi:geranylgeranyl pyrophosphate synthase
VSNELYVFIARHLPLIEDALGHYLPRSRHMEVGPFNDALNDAVFPGGKRLRPMLTLMGAAAAGVDAYTVLPAAAAMEYLHSSSLILDDMPAMDDADLRRGRATLHRVYGEGMTMLVALALLNQSYALLAQAASRSGDAATIEQVMHETTAAIGADGMIGGQAADIEVATRHNGVANLTTRNLKTTALMRLTMTAGALIGGAPRHHIEALARYGEALGCAYQVYDDLLDAQGETTTLGKTTRQDARHQRPSFVAELGVAGARDLTVNLIAQAKSTVSECFGASAATKLLDAAANHIFCGIGQAKQVAELVA